MNALTLFRRGGAWATLGLGLLMIEGCASTTAPPPSPPAPAARAAGPDAQNDFGAAMIQPFTDFNITRAEIAPVLKAAAAAPYGLPRTEGCGPLGAEVAALDAVLGPDLDLAPTGARSGDADRLAAGALRSLTTSWIPLRGILRRLTGAEAHAEAVKASILAGAVRRAYLKGLGEREGCPPPASPARHSPAP